MPVARVQINGRIARIEVPDGTTPEQAQAMAERMVSHRASNPPPKPASFFQGLAEGAAPYASNAVRVLNKFNPVLNIIDTVTGGPSKITAAADRNVNAALARSPYRGSTAGKVAGEMVGSLPTMALPGGLAVQGAASGLLGSRDRSARGLVTNAAIGAAGGYLGGKAVGAVAGAVSPRVAPAVAALRARDVPLTLGQIVGASGGIVGRTIRGAENKLTSVPGVGNAIVNAQRRGTEGFNRAAFNEALAPIGGQSGGVAETGVEHARGAVRDAYARALDGVEVPTDRQFGNQIGSALERGIAPGSYDEDFARIIGDEISPVLTERPGMLTGQGIQDALRMAKGYGRQYGKLATTGASGVPQPAARPVAHAFNDIADSVESLVQRYAPKVMPNLSAANQANRGVSVLRDAVDAAKNTGGVFTPAQLTRAASANAKKFGGTQGTTNQPFYDLTRAGQEVLPNDVPNSGTADRGIMGLVLGGTVGPPAIAASALGSLPYTRAGQAAIQKLLTGRQGDTSRAVAEAIRKLKPAGFLGGTAGLLSLFGS